jgi:hypothetical protein
MITAVTGPDRNRRLAGVLVGGLGAVAIIAALAGGWGGGAPHLSPKGLWFLACAGGAVLLGGLALMRGAPWTGGLAALLFLGGAAQLWLTTPDYFFFFHIRPQSAADGVMDVLIAAQAALSLAALWRWRERIRPVVAALGAGRLAMLVLLCGLLTVSVSGYLWRGDVSGYLVHLAAGAVLAGIGIANLAAILAAPDLPRLVPGPAAAARLSAAAPLLLPLAVFAIATVLAVSAFGGGALVEDETAYLFQARGLAAGYLKPPALPDAASGAFDYYLLSQDADGWYAVTTPGWPAVLALGVLLDIPFVVNPLLGALAVFLGHRLTDRWAGRRAADLTALMMASSPMLLILSASLMTHALALALTVGAWLLCTLAHDRAGQGRAMPAALAFAAGLLMGWLFLTRALEGVLLGGLTGLWLLWVFGRMRRPGPVLAYALGCIATGALLFAYNIALTGEPLTMPMEVYLARLWHAGVNEFGFGAHIGPPGGWGALDMQPGHSPTEAVFNTLNGLAFLGFDLQGWLWSSLLLIWAALIWRARGGYTAMMLVLAATVIGVHALYWFSATFYIGPRYWFGAFLAFAVLSAAGLQALGQRAQPVSPRAGARLTAVLCIAALFGATAFTGWRAVNKIAPRLAGYREVVHLADEAIATAGPDALVLLACQDLVEAAMIMNDPLLRPGAPVFALDRSEEADAALATALGGRTPVAVGSCPDPG